MQLSELEARENAVSRLEAARARRDRAMEENERAWGELQRAAISMVLDHHFSISHTAAVSGAHRRTVDGWVAFERKLRAEIGIRTDVPEA